jgi:hypothetical protein
MLALRDEARNFLLIQLVRDFVFALRLTPTCPTLVFILFNLITPTFSYRAVHVRIRAEAVIAVSVLLHEGQPPSPATFTLGEIFG